MSTRPNNSIAERLAAAKLALANVTAEAEVKSLLSDYGYSDAKLSEGRTLFDAADAAVAAQIAAHGMQQQATHDAVQAEKAARDAYQALAKVARAEFLKERASLATLGLAGAEPKSAAGFAAAATALFENAALMPTLSEFGYSPARLASERKKIDNFDLLNSRQEAAKGSAQQATRDSEAALEALDEWRAKLIKVARVALRGKPELLEKLGVPARSSRTAAQRAALKRRRGAKAQKQAA